MPIFLLAGAFVGGGGGIAYWKTRPRQPLSIPDAARAPTPASVMAALDRGEQEDGAPPAVQYHQEQDDVAAGENDRTAVQRVRDGPSRVCSLGADFSQNELAKARMQAAVRESEVLDEYSDASDSECDSEDELICGGRPSSTLQRGHASLARDTLRAAWLFEERPTLPQNAPVMHMLPSSASTHLYIVAESALGWMYVFEKWRDGVCAARFRNPDHARKYRAGFMGRYRRRKHVRQITSVAAPTGPDGSPLRVSDLLVWSAEHTEFRQFTDNCHTYAINLAEHLGMECPAGWWEQILYDTY